MPTLNHRAEISDGVRAAYKGLRDAMVAGDVVAMDALLADGFTLTHMTGHVQSRSDWLDDVRHGGMRYHEIDDRYLRISPDEERPRVDVRTLTDATVWGGRGSWRLRLQITFVRLNGSWVATDIVASTWT